MLGYTTVTICARERQRLLLLSTMWDDEFTSIRGPKQLINRLTANPQRGPRSRIVTRGERLPDPS